MSRQNLSWHAQIAFDRQAIKICSLGALDNMRKYKILASNKPCDNFNWMSHKKFNIYNVNQFLAHILSSTSLRRCDEGHYDRTLTRGVVQSLPKNLKYRDWLGSKLDPSRFRFKSKQKTGQKPSVVVRTHKNN